MPAKWLIAATAVASPLLLADGATVTAVDPAAWRADPGGGTVVTVAAGERVTFRYPAGGRSIHSVSFTGPQPTRCDDTLARDDSPRPAPWSGECLFERPGAYPFACAVHPAMTGRVIAQEPAASPSPSPSPSASPSPAPSPSAQPGLPPAPTATPAPAPKPLTVAMRARQRGDRVRGTARAALGARLDVRLHVKARRAGRWTGTAAAGATAFAVKLDARARRDLRARGRLTVKVTVSAVTGGKRTFIVRLRR